MQGAHKLATYEDLLALPEDVRAEIIDGVVVTPPAPLPRHACTAGALRSFIGRPFHDDDGRGGPGGWWILPEVDVRFEAHEVLRPDLAGWRRTRLPSPWDMRPIDVIPDWVCEVLSPTNIATDRVKKRRIYATHGVPFYWIVDPESRTLEALRLQGGQWLEIGVFDDMATARVAPFEEIELELGRLFPPVAPAP